MAESVQSPEDAAAARAAEQARLRKERREAKIRAGGAARLNKITGLGGGIQREPPPPQPPSPSSAPPSSQPTATPAVQSHDDPAEVDISKHHYEPHTTPRQPADPSNISEAQLRQMMLGLDQPSQNPLAGAQTPAPGMDGMEEDPMMKMLSQMMSGGGMPGMPGGGPSGGANPFVGTGMESLFAGGNPMQQAQQQATPPNKTANLWRILHAIFALGLGLYVALSTTFTGTKTERDDSTIASSGETDDIERTRASFFYIFTSVEAVLLTTQYFLDRNRSPPSGMLWSVSGFLPEPFGGYLKHALRYGQIFTTVRGDALVCVFVLGVCCWLRS